ncbi:MAG: sodium:proton antiporter [Prevotella sp.]|nr:sodium:proton antiporter [Prevotella sp.]
MTLIIVAILLFCYLLITTENLTNVNKAATAVFAGTLAWILYIAYGADYVMQFHPEEYAAFMDGEAPSSATVKEFIAQNVFLKYVGRASEIVMFLLATMTIVEVLTNNGCFDFVMHLMKTRNSRKMLWIFASVAFLFSINLDNLSTTVMMLTIMHKVIGNRRQRMVYGAAIVIAANCGGALTVIGDPAGLVLWTKGFVTATNFSMSLLVPCLIAWLLPTWWIGRQLPERCDTEWITMPYRGDDTRLNGWQRLLMLFVGIGGLWFIPSFHSITKLSPFIGALCVLGVLWIVNEIFNHRLYNSDQLLRRKVPGAMQYGVLQMMFFVMGMMLLMGVVRESGAVDWFVQQSGVYIKDTWLMGLVAGFVSAILDNFATAISFFELADHVEMNGIYWKAIAFASGVGGNILCIGSLSGIALMKLERLRVGWYFRNVGWKSLVGMLIGMAAMFLINY